MDGRLAVLVHARREERYEFTQVRYRLPEADLVDAVAAVRTAEGTPI